MVEFLPNLKFFLLIMFADGEINTLFLNFINHLYNNNCIHLKQERHPSVRKEF